jgi:phage gp46-like protein
MKKNGFGWWRDALAHSDVGSRIAVAQGLDDLEDVRQLSGVFARKY